MIIRTLAALAALATAAWAQTEPAPETAATVLPLDTSARETVESASAETAAPAPALALPTDPMELAAFALANAREPARCRFAFTRLQTAAAQVGWSDADAEAVIRFDPRLAIGERWTVVRATRHQRAMQRSLAREDRKGLPSDLITLTAEGEWTFENLAFVREHEDRYVYSYTPVIIPERSASEAGEGIIEQLIGEVEISRESGRVMSSTLREPPPGTAVRAMGIVRVHRALLRSHYVPREDGLHVADSGSQMFAMSALLSQTEVTTSFRFTEVEPICDPAEVARIQEAEAAAVAAHAD
jgi:hypothetical protein